MSSEHRASSRHSILKPCEVFIMDCDGAKITLQLARYILHHVNVAVTPNAPAIAAKQPSPIVRVRFAHGLGIDQPKPEQFVLATQSEYRPSLPGVYTLRTRDAV